MLQDSRRTAPGTQRPTTPLLAAGLVALLALTWLLSGELAADTEPLGVALGRTAVCAAVLCALAAARPEGRAGARAVLARPGAVAALALLGFAGYAAGTLLAMPRIGTSLTNVTVALLPCFSVVIGALFFGERASARMAAGALLATAAAAGYAALGADGAPLDAAGLLLAAGATAGFSAYTFLYRRSLAALPPLAVLPVLLGAASVLLVPLSLPALLAHPPTPAQWGGIVLLGGAVYAPAYLVQHRLILLRGPVFVAALQLAVPFTVRIGEWALGGSPAPGPYELALLAVCCGGIALVTVRPRARAAADPDGPVPGRTRCRPSER
ncbi:DMT family transporter [Streptomyces sp. NPDC051940]|uniref:DMT family transporter n=1 Tax=Streptomyces sp. NPDC051940 TaxID=3155675 RepID=UPI0034268C80